MGGFRKTKRLTRFDMDSARAAFLLYGSGEFSFEMLGMILNRDVSWVRRVVKAGGVIVPETRRRGGRPKAAPAAAAEPATPACFGGDDPPENRPGADPGE